jgi:hypothetical protein
MKTRIVSYLKRQAVVPVEAADHGVFASDPVELS